MDSKINIHFQFCEFHFRIEHFVFPWFTCSDMVFGRNDIEESSLMTQGAGRPTVSEVLEVLILPLINSWTLIVCFRKQCKKPKDEFMPKFQNEKYDTLSLTFIQRNDALVARFTTISKSAKPSQENRNNKSTLLRFYIAVNYIAVWSIYLSVVADISCL